MSDTYIPIKKLSDVHNSEFYPLTAAKGTITTEDIIVKNVLGGNKYKTKVPSGENLYDILTEMFGAKLDVLSEFIDTETLTNEKTRVPSSYLLRKLLLSILGGDLNLKFKVCTYTQYKAWLDAGTIDANTLYFTTGGVPKEYWTITLNANGGSVSPSTLAIEKGSSYGTLPTPTYSGYTFQGWYTSASGGTKINSTDIPTSNTTLFAHWISNTATVTFNANGGSVSPATKTVTKGTAIGDMPTPTYSGHEFTGWFTAATGGTKITTATIINNDITFYAHWTVVTEDDLLCLEEDHSQLVVTEDKIYNINLNESTEPILATEVNHDPVETEDHNYKISLKSSSDPLLATEIAKDLVDSEDKLNNFKIGTNIATVSTQVPASMVKKLTTASQLAQVITSKKKTRKRKA